MTTAPMAIGAVPFSASSYANRGAGAASEAGRRTKPQAPTMHGMTLRQKKTMTTTIARMAQTTIRHWTTRHHACFPRTVGPEAA